jgi:Family of unknown function (DUF6493)
VKERLDELLAKGDLAQCAEFFQSMPEKERKQCAVHLANIYENSAPKPAAALPRSRRGRQIDLALIMQDVEAMRAAAQNGSGSRIPSRNAEYEAAPIQALRLALLATSSFNMVKTSVWPLPEPTMAISVLKDRKPDWLDKWALHLLKRDARRSWTLVRGLEREGLINPPEASEYYVGMMLHARGGTGLLAPDALLLTDTNLFDSRVWEMLHSEQAMENAWSAKNWRTALLHHCKTGTVSRKKLVDETLDGLLRHSVSQSSANQAALSWFTDMYNELEPGSDDVRDCVSNYLRLLASPGASVLKLGLAELNKYPEQIPAEELCAQIGNAFRAKGKEHLFNALKLLEVIAQRDERAKVLVIDCLLDAIASDNVEFRDRAFSMFDKLALSSNIDAIKKLREMQAELGSLKPRVEEWLKSHDLNANSNIKSIRSAAGAKAKPISSIDPSPFSDKLQVRSRVSNLEAEVAALAGISELLVATEDGNLPYVRALDLTDQRIPRLIAENAIEPIANLDDLIFLLHRILEGKCKADEVEQALDGMARLCDQRPEDFERRVTPLKKQAQRQLTPPERSQIGVRVPMPFIGKHYLDDMAALIQAWTDKKQFTLQSAVDKLKDVLSSATSQRVEGNGEYQKVVDLFKTANPSSQDMGSASQDVAAEVLKFPQQPGSNSNLKTDNLLRQAQEFVNKVDNANVGPEELKTIAIDMLSNDTYLKKALVSAQGRMHPLHFFSGRAVGISRRLANGKAAPLLAAPTHRGGWIDARVIPERIGTIRTAGAQIDALDAIQMLLRLAPEHRAEALADCKEITGELGDALKYALGGPVPAEMKTDSLWIAAARARSPFEDDPLVSERFPKLGPDAAEVATYDLNLGQLKENISISSTFFDKFDNKFLSAKQERKGGSIAAQFPTVLLHTKVAPNIMTGDFMSKPVCEVLIWPQNRESYFAVEARQLSSFIESEGSYWKGEWEPLFDSDVDLRGNGRWLIALALTAKQQEVRRLGVDALIASIDEGRLDGNALGEVLAQALDCTAVTVSRWLTSFEEVSKISPLHAQVIRVALERSLTGVRRSDFKTPIKLIELLYELCCGSAEAITDECARQFFENASNGTGKMTKLSKQLLALNNKGSLEHRKAAAAYALERRIERVNRWQNSLNTKAPTLAAVTR